ncbi:MAG: hypothetical protein ACI4XP_05805 [Acutalibacteraceae bacterium]
MVAMTVTVLHLKTDQNQTMTNHREIIPIKNQKAVHQNLLIKRIAQVLLQKM